MSARPVAVTLLCALGGILIALTVILLSVNALWVVPPSAGQRAAAFAAVAAMAAALYGMWRMRRWGVMLVGALLLVRVIYGLAAHLPWNLPALAGPVVLLLVGLLYLRRMA
jgi:hypothetical protein